MKTFITTYRSFTSPEELLNKLIQRYHVPEEHADKRLPIQLRICNVLKHWIETQYGDFSEDLIVKLQDFLYELQENASTGKHAKQTLAYLQKVKVEFVITCQNYSTNLICLYFLYNLQKQDENQTAKNEIVNLTIEAKIPLSPANLLFIFDEEELARQLTLVDFNIYENIQVR
jgi:hypothetical protein